MPVLKLYSEVVVKEEESTAPFFTNPGRSLFHYFLSIFSSRNHNIDQRIEKIKRASVKPWSTMNEQERIAQIYRTMAEEKAIERLLRLKG
jgi:hypothetical protein